MNERIVVDHRVGGSEYYIGSILKYRMDALGKDLIKLSDESLVDEDIINDLINNNLSISEVDMVDMDFIAKALYCSVEYFTDEKVRKNDILHTCLNRGTNCVKSNMVKVKICSIMEDFEFMNDIYNEVIGCNK